MAKHILIIEDDLFIRDLYTFAFSKSNYTVDSAEDGEIAIQKASTQPYDAILLDIMLPKVSGMEVLKKLRSSQNSSTGTPIILSTNLAEEKIIKEALTLGADGYIVKADTEPMDVVKQVDSFIDKAAHSS